MNITIHTVNGTKLFGIFDATPSPAPAEDITWTQEQ